MDKNKVGKVGWKYKYRVSNKLKQLAKSGKTVKKGSVKLIPIEIVDYLDDPIIPYCDQVFSEETNIQNLVNGNTEEKIIDEKPMKKPKVGYEYRYRISKMIEAKNNNHKSSRGKLDKNIVNKKSNKNVEEKSEKKPKVGYKYRYRISKMLDAKKKPPVDESLLQDSIDKDDDIYSPKMKPKVGWEYRYRIQRKTAAERINPTTSLKSKPINTKSRTVTEKNKKALTSYEEESNKNLNTHKIGIVYYCYSLYS